MRSAGTYVGFAILTLAFLQSGCIDSSPSSRTGGTPAVGSVPPEVMANDWLNTDTPQTLADLRGSVVLVEFWATWCGPCVQGIPHLNELQAHHGDKGLRILSFTAEDRRTVETFQKKSKKPIEYTVGLESRLASTYGVTGIPHAFVVGRDGKLVWEGHPAEPACEKAIVTALARK